MFQYYTLLMAPQGQDGGSGMTMNLMFIAFMVLIFYFMIIRPSSKRRKDHQKMLDALKKGDKIITSSGIYGTVAGMDEKTILVQIADNVKIKLDRSSISAVI